MRVEKTVLICWQDVVAENLRLRSDLDNCVRENRKGGSLIRLIRQPCSDILKKRIVPALPILLHK